MTKRQLGFSILFTALAFAGCVNAPPLVVVEQPAALEARAPALRTQLDFARGMRWELHWGRVEAYDLASRQLIRSLALPGAVLAAPGDAGIPDMVLERNGALLVSSNITTRIWRISPARFEMEVFDIETDADGGKDFGWTALARGRKDREIYAASNMSGALWRIDLATGTAARVER